MAAMHDANLLRPVLGKDNISKADMVDRMGNLSAAEEKIGMAVNPIRRLSVLTSDVPKDRLKLSKAQSMRMARILSGAKSNVGMAEMGYRNGCDIGVESALVRSAREASPAPTPKDVADIVFGSKQRLPISAADLMPQYTGKPLGVRMRQLEDSWVSNAFKTGKDDLLKMPRAGSGLKTAHQTER
jgi:poly(A) polymerase